MLVGHESLEIITQFDFHGTNSKMTKFESVIGQEILEVEEKENELTIIIRDNRYLFIKVVDGKLTVDSVPE